jgi:circadian clock protein KaiB
MNTSHAQSGGAGTERAMLRLYVAGQSPKSLRAIENLTVICEEHMAGEYELAVIDLLEEPRLAKEDEIVAVPTLIRAAPEPVRRIIGDLSDTDRVLAGLQLSVKRQALTRNEELT